MIKFSQIKDKIKNLGNFKSVKEIKKAGLRICRNTKTGEYWLIEREYLKPLFQSQKEISSILINRNFLKKMVIICHHSPKELRNTAIMAYIKWGEQQKFHKRPSVLGRKYWYDLGKQEANDFIILRFRDKRNWTPIVGDADIQIGDVVFVGKFNKVVNRELHSALLNSTLHLLSVEIYGRINLGDGLLTTYGPEIKQFLSITERCFTYEQKNKVLSAFRNLSARRVQSIYEELGFNPRLPIRDQEPDPLPDRKELDDIIFDILGLTQQERKEVYWAVCELVKNRLEKARSV